MQATYAFSQSVLPVGAEATVDVLLTFRAAAVGEARPARRPLNLSLVIDRSASMAGNSLRQALRAADALVERGATFSSVEDIAARCAYVFLSLPRPTDVLELLQGENGLAELLKLLLEPSHPLAESGPCRLLLGQLLLGLHHLTLQVSYLFSQPVDTAPEEGDRRHVTGRRSWRASLLRRLRRRRLREQRSGRRLQLCKRMLNE